MGSQARPKTWRLLGTKTVNRAGNLPELEIFGSDVIEVRGIFLLDLVFEDADVFALRNLHKLGKVQLGRTPLPSLGQSVFHRAHKDCWLGDRRGEG